MRVLEETLGHDIAFAVEAGKIAANDAAAIAPPEIDLTVLEAGLRVPLPTAMLTFTLAEMAQEIASSALATVAQADMQPRNVTRLIFVGGSSLMGVVDDALCGAFPEAEVHRGAALTAIVQGLAMASETAFA